MRLTDHYNRVFAIDALRQDLRAGGVEKRSKTQDTRVSGGGSRAILRTGHAPAVCARPGGGAWRGDPAGPRSSDSASLAGTANPGAIGTWRLPPYARSAAFAALALLVVWPGRVVGQPEEPGNGDARTADARTGDAGTADARAADARAEVDALPAIDATEAVKAHLGRLHSGDWSRFDLLEVKWTNGEPVAGARIGPFTGATTPTANGSLLLYAEVEREASTPLRLPLSVTVRPWARVPVAARGLVRGETLMPDDVRVEERALLELRGAKPSLGCMNAGATKLRARSEIHAGDILTMTAVEEAPLVASGDRVTILLRSGGIRLSATGVARRSGRSGEVIPVENLDSRRKVLASVVDDRTVEVRP